MGLQLCFVDFHEWNIVKLSFTYMSRDEEAVQTHLVVGICSVSYKFQANV